ncbi:hypothetical protein PybrP1_000826 [[Pythium] brassicae (nom. inval.)]|nr:hypothetical protein PybrP1_000826 [[Pythium] brassicae (nom. inval.)]
MAKWLSLFKFGWLRRCKTCRVRGAKCLCKRPSLALEHIFFLEERKNKYGARNFSHVSDTMVTTASSAPNQSVNNTVLLRGSSFSDEYAFADLYYNPSGSGNGSGNGNAASTPPRRPSPSGSASRGSQGSHDSARSSVDSARKKSGLKRAAPGTSIVRKNSGRLVPASGRRHQRFEELPNEYTLYSEQSGSALGGQRRPLRLQSGSGSAGSSFKFYGRSGGSSSASTSKSGSLVLSAGSKNDSFVLGSSVSSSVRLSVASDCMSVDNNFGSYNPRGRFLENGSCIQEDAADDDADALRQLNGWLQASPTSTAGSFAAPRNIHCF